jgi:hypothetical protein
MSQTHLLRRNAVFYYHRRVPLPLVEKLGKKVILFSLGTTNPKEAKKLRAAHDLQWDARFDAVNQGPGAPKLINGDPPSELGLLQLVKDYVEQADSKARMATLADPPDNMSQKAEIKADIEIGRSILQNIDDPRRAQWLQSTAAKVLGPSGTTTPISNSDIFAEIVRRGLLELQNRQLARLEDDFSRPFFDQAFNPQNEPPAVTFGQVADQFIALTDEHAKANSTSQKWVAVSANMTTELVVQRDSDQGRTIDEPIPFGLAVTLTMPGVVEIYDQVRARLAIMQCAKP